MFNLIYKKRIYEKKYKNQQLKKQFENSYLEVYDLNTFNNETVEKTYKEYPNLRDYMFRHLSTKQERSLYLMHENEYLKEYNLKLRKKRSARQLPTEYDDIRSFVRKSSTSWKHSTKRRRQYYK